MVSCGQGPGTHAVVVVSLPFASIIIYAMPVNLGRPKQLPLLSVNLRFKKMV